MNSGSDSFRKINPREKANIFSILTFLYTIPVYIKGFKNDLKEKDIYKNISRCKSATLGDKLENAWDQEVKSGKRSLARALLRVFGKEYAIYGVLYFFAKTSFGVIKPKLIGKLIGCFDQRHEKIDISDGYMYGSLVVLVSILNAVTFHGYMVMVQEFGIRLRIAISSLIYRKTLKLKQSSLIKINNGRIITNVSRDAYAFDGATMFLNDLWIGSLQLPILGYFMYQEVGLAGAISMGFLLLLIPIQLYVAKNIQKARLKLAAATDQRLHLIQEILTSIKIIKMYVWEKFFLDMIGHHRAREMKYLRVLLYWKTFLIGLGTLSLRVSYFICVLLYMVFGHKLSAKEAFVVLGYYNSLRSVVGICLPMGVFQITESLTAIKRITEVLTAEETIQNIESSEEGKVLISAQHVDMVIGNDTILENINVSISSGLIGVTGPIGSGKSSLLKLLVQDVDIAKGSLEVFGEVSYASQEPWLFPGTIKQNILFGEPYNPARYESILSICALRTDLEMFPNGDETLVIDRGLNLSKGQQARVNLARAVYREADIYLLDDALTALDTHVGRHIFTNCIKTFLKNKLVILVTHSKQFLRETDKIIVIERGSIENIATPEDVDHLNTGIDGLENPETKGNISRKQSHYQDANEANSEEDKLLEQTPKTGIYYEEKREGGVTSEIYKFYLQNGGGFTTIFWVLCMFISAQIASSWFDYYISVWVKTEQSIGDFESLNLTNTSEYFEMKETRNTVFITYSLLIFFSASLSMVQVLVLFYFTTKASFYIHRTILSKVIDATMNFFDLHLSGSILNRFSRDTAAVDEFLPITISACIRTLFTLFGVVAIIATTSVYSIGISVTFCVVLYLVKFLYMPTARSLKRLDNATRSPVVGHINATLEGLTTVRASKAQNILTNQFDDHQDLHCSASFMYTTTNRAFGFFLEIVNATLAAIVIYMFLIFRDEFPAGIVGLVITQIFTLTQTLQWGMRMWAELESTMTSLERMVEYSKVEKEDKVVGNAPQNWPDNGGVNFNGVSLYYKKSEEPILKSICFGVEPKEKIGIIGRTGAGKTSIISTIFRLYPIEGEILIDNTDITNIQIEFLRRRISIIPQDPILFSGTLRSNLDPTSEHSDEKIWSTLSEVNLKSAVESLDMVINDGGGNFSTGQKQLICLGRAILRNNKILVLDEATANVDPETDVFIQETIKRKFSNCTILTIAHRLETVMNSDKVMVMDKGCIIEFGRPIELLENEEGKFYSMVKQSGLLEPKDKDV